MMYMAYFMRKKRLSTRIIIWFTIFAIISSPSFAYAQATIPFNRELQLYSKSCVLMDGDSGRILYEKEGSLALANASTTKILTCIVCLENADLSDIVTASSKAAAQPKVHLGMKQGDQFYLKDLLYAMMLESYNDCAMALAEHVGESMEGFAELMNSKAAEIGCTDTYFVTPNGLDAETDEGSHHTTAADLARIMKYCCWDSDKSSEFLEITQTLNYSFSGLDGATYSVSNKNAFLSMMSDAISGKTGYTSKAGYCYVAALESEGRKYTIALLACGWPNNRTYKWSDAKALFSYGKEHYRKEEIVFLSDYADITVVNGRRTNATLRDWGKVVWISVKMTTDSPDTSYLLAENEQLEYETILPDKIYHAVKSQDMVGKTQCLLNETVIAECIISAAGECELWDFSSFFQCFCDAFLFKN
jgi:D-alanyl-D-alanine carboxypeptidase (penicillin-binding protein 5/6)